MTQSFHAGATPSHTRVHPNRRRTDLTPTVTASGMGTGMGQPLSSREISRASTPGRRMMMPNTNGKSPGKAVSMSRLDQLARPRVLNLNDSKNAYPSERSPSHAPVSLTNNARLTNRRGKIGQTSSKNFSASMSQLNGPSTGTFAPKVGHRARPPLSASSSTRTRPRTGGKDDEGRVHLLSLNMVTFKCGCGSSYDSHCVIPLSSLSVSHSGGRSLISHENPCVQTHFQTGLIPLIYVVSFFRYINKRYYLGVKRICLCPINYLFVISWKHGNV